MAEENKIRDAADAIKGIADSIPVYQDVVQPAAKEVGLALQTIVKTIHIALAPIGALVWGYDQVKEFITAKLADKLRNIPQDEIQTPPANVAGPILEALKYTGYQESLRELYANLLASSMDKMTALKAHPGFVEMIKQMTPDEADLMHFFARGTPLPLINIRAKLKDGGGGLTILKHFSLFGFDAGCDYPELTPSYLDNLCRLGLIEIPAYSYYTDKKLYEPLEDDKQIKEIIGQISKEANKTPEVDRGRVEITELGAQFITACVQDHLLLRANK
jgi:hypothetical protein